ncbi:hypothetical protein EJ08DRAFT_701236 [Tothia fuscella]|uniref:Secreted protein n=1 Tax=Tothia fuscella TaxID=1048955 RepID=A0A9P4TV15_9PEZI|nr:hypothetical protein EJ08DRAFT_701236 [Tothia fuscella]
MHLSFSIYILFPLCIQHALAYQCASWVPPEECVKSAAAFSERMKTARPVFPTTNVRAASPPPTKNCGGMAMMDADVLGCGPLRRPKPANASPTPTTLATQVVEPSPAVTERKL